MFVLSSATLDNAEYIVHTKEVIKEILATCKQVGLLLNGSY